MAARGILPGFQLLIRRSQQIQLLRSITTIQFAQISPSNSSRNNVKWKCDTALCPGSLLKTYNLNCSIIRRWKFGKKQKSKGDKYDSDEEDEKKAAEDLDTESLVAHSKNAKISNTTMSSMRIDAIVKSGLGIARNKAEAALYEGKLRVNGNKPMKKGLQIKIGDVIDFVHGPSPKNEKFLLVTRITILDADLKENNYKIKMLRERALVIENYETSWEPVSENS